MPEAVADATVLIFLGRLRRLEWLREAWETVLVPPAVEREVVARGAKDGYPDATRTAEAIESGWIVVEEPESTAPIEKYGLETGETAVLSLALEREHDTVLVDEESVREVARLHDLEPRGTLGVLFDALDSGELGFDEFVEHVEQLLEAGFYLDESLYLEVIRQARRIAKKSQ
jgi:predicted nucleic acid-binding protein